MAEYVVRFGLFQRKLLERRNPFRESGRQGGPLDSLMCGNRGRRRVEPLDFHENELARTALSETGRTNIVGQDVGISVDADLADALDVPRIVPSSGRQLRNARPNVLGNPRARQAPTAVVVNPDDVSVANSSHPGIRRVQAQPLPPLNF